MAEMPEPRRKVAVGNREDTQRVRQTSTVEEEQGGLAFRRF